MAGAEKRGCDDESLNGPEASLIVDSPLSIHRGFVQPPFDGGFTINLGYPFANALIQLIPLTKGGASCTIDSVSSQADDADDRQLIVRYVASDNDALAQISYILFVTL